MVSRCILSAIALLTVDNFGVCEYVAPNATSVGSEFLAAKRRLGDPLFSGRVSEAIQLWDLPRLDDALMGNNQAYLLTSASANVESDAAKADLFVASLSNLVYPAVTYAYFDVKANYDLSEDKDKHSSFAVGASATGMAAVMSKLFQFKDEDGDGKFTENVDTVIDEYPFVEKELLGYYGPKPKWDSGEFSGNAKTAKIKTKDGVFAVTLKANGEEWFTPGGSKMTEMNTKVDIEINYPKLQEGNLVGLEAFVVSTTADASLSVEAGHGLYVEQPDNQPMLGFAWDGEATLVSDKSTMEVKASGVLDASLDEIKVKDLILGGIGAKAKVDAGAKLEVKKINFAFNQGKAGNVFWDPSVGMGSPEDSLMSGASGVAPWTSMLLALLLSAASVKLSLAN